MFDCSIIIPVYNKASLTVQCLNTLLSRPRQGVSFEIIVVDDASTDMTPQVLVEYADRIRVLTQSANAGFSTACNRGAAAAVGRYLVFLNNDTIPQVGWLEELVGYAEGHPRAAVVGSKLLFLDGTIQHAGLVVAQDRYPRHIYAGFPADHPAVNKSRQFQMVTASCALFQRQPFEQVGGYDTAFCNGYEDVDLCLRLGELGQEVHYCHRSVLYHLESVSEGRFKDTEENVRTYRERWAHRVRPDDLQYYVEDGLIGVEHGLGYPVRLTISPRLAVIDDAAQKRQTDSLLNARARQMFALLKENTHLSVRVQEAEHQAAWATRHANGHVNGHVNGHGRGVVARPRPVTREPRLLFQGQIHRRSGEPSDRVISMIMPVKNAAERLREILPRILRQQTRDSIEIVAVDSGSSDETIEVLRQASATVVSIDPLAFNHGLTRNLGARHARGQVFVFLNKNTTPADDHWLANLVAPLDGDGRLAAVCSRVLPGPDADRLTYKDGINDLSASPQRRVRAITDPDEYRGMPHYQLREFINFHTVGTAIRPQVLKQIPFREVETIGEDILWAKEVLEAGHKLQHEPSSVVLHSHNFSPFEFLQLNVDDGIANRDMVGRQMADVDVVPTIFVLVRDDWHYLEKQCQLDADELERWRFASVLRRTGQIVGQWIGVNQDRMPGDLASALSRVNRTRAEAAEALPRLG